MIQGELVRKKAGKNAVVLRITLREEGIGAASHLHVAEQAQTVLEQFKDALLKTKNHPMNPSNYERN